MSIDLWQRSCERLAAELPEQQFNTWIRPLPAAEIAEQGEAGMVAIVRVPNRFKLDWIRNQYAARIETVLSDLAGQSVRLDITLAPREGSAVPFTTVGSDGRASSTSPGIAAMKIGDCGSNPHVRWNM